MMRFSDLDLRRCPRPRFHMTRKRSRESCLLRPDSISALGALRPIKAHGSVFHDLALSRITARSVASFALTGPSLPQ